MISNTVAIMGILGMIVLCGLAIWLFHKQAQNSKDETIQAYQTLFLELTTIQQEANQMLGGLLANDSKVISEMTAAKDRYAAAMLAITELKHALEAHGRNITELRDKIISKQNG